MKNSANLGRCYPPRPSASVDNTLLDLQNSSYPTQHHSIIAKYSACLIVKPRGQTKVTNKHDHSISFCLCPLGLTATLNIH